MCIAAGNRASTICEIPSGQFAGKTWRLCKGSFWTLDHGGSFWLLACADASAIAAANSRAPMSQQRRRDSTTEEEERPQSCWIPAAERFDDDDLCSRCRGRREWRVVVWCWWSGWRQSHHRWLTWHWRWLRSWKWRIRSGFGFEMEDVVRLIVIEQGKRWSRGSQWYWGPTWMLAS